MKFEVKRQIYIICSDKVSFGDIFSNYYRVPDIEIRDLFATEEARLLTS